MQVHHELEPHGLQTLQLRDCSTDQDVIRTSRIRSDKVNMAIYSNLPPVLD